MLASTKEHLPRFFVLIILMSLQLLAVQCVEFEVGGNSGWATPPAKDAQLYNDWASKNRFKVNDTLSFKYNKDSVLVVTEEEYEKCRSSHPIYFSNNGETLFALDRPGLFYFISGVAGHCQRGLKMIVKVLEIEVPPQATAQSSHHKSGAATVLAFVAAPRLVPVIVVLKFLDLF